MDDEQLYYAASADGFLWQPLNKGQPVLKATTPKASIRDPFVSRTLGGSYRLVSTNGEGFGATPTILTWASDDLVTWHNETLVQFSVFPGAQTQNTWAPEWHYSPTTGDYLVFAAVRGTGLPLWAPCSSNNSLRFAFFARHTADFASFSAPYLLFDPGCNTSASSGHYGGVDGDIVLDELGRAVMVYKDEATLGNRLALSASGLVTGPFLNANEGVTLATLVEAPELVYFGDQWLLYQDCSFHPTPPGYPRPPYGVMASTRLAEPNFTAVPGSCSDTNPALGFPKGATHGSFLCLTDAELALLLAAYPPAPA